MAGDIITVCAYIINKMSLCIGVDVYIFIVIAIFIASYLTYYSWCERTLTCTKVQMFFLWSSIRSLDHSQILLENMIIRFYTNFWSSCSLSTAVIKAKTKTEQILFADHIICVDKNPIKIEECKSSNLLPHFETPLYILTMTCKYRIDTKKKQFVDIGLFILLTPYRTNCSYVIWLVNTEPQHQLVTELIDNIVQSLICLGVCVRYKNTEDIQSSLCPSVLNSLQHTRDGSSHWHTAQNSDHHTARHTPSWSLRK